MNMKRIICAVLVLFLLPVCASAVWTDDYLEDFSIYAELFGAPELDKSTAFTSDVLTLYSAGKSMVGFSTESGKLKGVTVFAEGDDFLIYSMAALSLLEKSNANFTYNCGALLAAYLMCHKDNGEARTGVTKDGLFFMVQIYKDPQYMLIVER